MFTILVYIKNPKNATKKWIAYFKSQGVAAIVADCKSGKGLNLYRPLIKEVLADKIKSYEEKKYAGQSSASNGGWHSQHRQKLIYQPYGR